MKKAIAVILFAIACNSVAIAQNEAEEYAEKNFVTKKGDTLLYQMLYPLEYGSQNKYPQVVFLTDTGARDTDNTKHLIHGGSFLQKQEVRHDFQASVIFPNCPTDIF